MRTARYVLNAHDSTTGQELNKRAIPSRVIIHKLTGKYLHMYDNGTVALEKKLSMNGELLMCAVWRMFFLLMIIVKI